jgi:hypothetical protein
LIRQLPEDDTPPMNLMGWIRSRFYGNRRDQDRLSSVLRRRSQLGGFSKGYETPFDDPPAEPVALDPDLPWELRE